MAIHTVLNNDTGSLRLGTIQAKIGDKILVNGQTRTITYLMGSAAKGNLHAVTAKQGPWPMGEVRFDLNPEEKQSVSLEEQLAALAKEREALEAQLAAQTRTPEVVKAPEPEKHVVQA